MYGTSDEKIDVNKTSQAFLVDLEPKEAAALQAKVKKFLL